MPEPAWIGPLTQLVEAADSPQHSFAQVASITRTYRGLHSLCVSSALPRGTQGTGDMLGYWVTSSTVSRAPGRVGKLVINWEAVTADSLIPTPPDEFGIEPFEINPSILKNPKFTNSDGTSKVSIADLQTLENLRSAQTIDGQTTLRTNLSTQLAKDAFDTIVRGTENFYLSGFRYFWTRYFWTVVGTVSRGGFIQAPSGPLTALLPAGLSWLREADALDFTGQYYKYTMKWIGGPGGHWDPTLYQ